MSFYPNQKVVCIDASKGFVTGGNVGLVNDKIYTFKQYTGTISSKAFPEIFVCEIPDVYLCSSRFKPLIEKSDTSIEEVISNMEVEESQLVLIERK